MSNNRRNVVFVDLGTFVVDAFVALAFIAFAVTFVFVAFAFAVTFVFVAFAFVAFAFATFVLVAFAFATFVFVACAFIAVEEEVSKLCLHVGHVLFMRNQRDKLCELKMCPQ